jgi:hypothetical protein
VITIVPTFGYRLLVCAHPSPGPHGVVLDVDISLLHDLAVQVLEDDVFASVTILELV